MAETGHNWGSYAFVQESSSDWDGDLLADNATDTSDVITVDTKSAIMVGMIFVEDNTGAINGVVTVAVLGTWDDTTYEDAPTTGGGQVGNPLKFTVTPVQNDTVVLVFSLDPRDYNLFKIAVLNESGQELAVSVKYKTATIPVAS
jgi:hypothetical protein